MNRVPRRGGTCYFFSRARKSNQKGALSFALNWCHKESAKETRFEASIGAHSSGGIIAQPAKMWLSEYRFAAVCAFEQGKIGGLGLCSGFASLCWYQYDIILIPLCQEWNIKKSKEISRLRKIWNKFGISCKKSVKFLQNLCYLPKKFDII